MKVKKHRPEPNPLTQVLSEEPINVPDGDGWGIARLPSKMTDADKQRAG